MNSENELRVEALRQAVVAVNAKHDPTEILEIQVVKASEAFYSFLKGGDHAATRPE